MATKNLNGDQAFAFGACDAGIKMVTSYPGSPSSGTVEAIIPAARRFQIYVEWSSNERVALEMAIGASIAGRRALVCTKSVGMNVMLDPLMALNLTPIHGGLVILLGDDPGGYGSQNDQDTRPLAAMSEIPLLEPASPREAYQMMRQAFDVSEKYSTPIIIRETRRFTQETESVEVCDQPAIQANREFNKESLRFVPVPKNVIEKHRQLHLKLASLIKWANNVDFNHVTGQGERGIIAAGFAYTKLVNILGEDFSGDFRVFKLGALNPLPEELLIDFLRACSTVLILEENEPFIETRVKALAHECRAATLILGKKDGLVNREGELFRWQIQKALKKYHPKFAPSNNYFRRDEARERPKKESFCADCRYEEVLDLLEKSARQLKQEIALVGDPGCLVTVAERLTAKYAIGSAVAVAGGMSKAGADVKPVALIGDSGFFHSTLPAICNAVHNQSDILMVVLDNGTTLTSGSQPHPGVQKNALGEAAPKLDIKLISESCGVGYVKTVALDHPESEIVDHIKMTLQQTGPTMLIVRIPMFNPNRSV